MEDPSSNANIDIGSYGIQLEWENLRGAGIEVELLRGFLDPDIGLDINRHALSLMLSQQINEKYIPYLRYEYLDPNDKISNDSGEVIILGINMGIDDNFFIKVEIDQFITGDSAREATAFVF